MEYFPKEIASQIPDWILSSPVYRVNPSLFIKHPLKNGFNDLIISGIYSFGEGKLFP